MQLQWLMRENLLTKQVRQPLLPELRHLLMPLLQHQRRKQNGASLILELHFKSSRVSEKALSDAASGSCISDGGTQVPAA